jgi:hypothetical protein
VIPDVVPFLSKELSTGGAMSTATTASTGVRRWISSDEMRALQFVPAGAEIENGRRWGEQRNIRICFAPHADGHGGYLYAHDASTDRYLLLAAHTTRAQVEAVRRELNGCTATSDGYLALAALDGAALPVEQARGLLLHCVDREMTAHQDFLASSAAEPVRFDAAYAVVVQRSARVAAEELQIDSARAVTGAAPVVIRYRVPDVAGWTGRVAGECLAAATAEARRIERIAGRHDIAVQATSVNQGHASVAAARVPELGFIAHRAEVPPGAPRLGM